MAIDPKDVPVTILGLVGPLFLFLSCPLSLLTHLGPFPSDSHRPLPIYSIDPLMCTFVSFSISPL